MSKEISSPLPVLKKGLAHLRPYANVLVFLLFALAYAFVILRINSLSNPKVDESTVTTAVKASPVPHLDQAAAEQLQTLKDNSVNVQTLLDQNRTNPFQE